VQASDGVASWEADLRALGYKGTALQHACLSRETVTDIHRLAYGTLGVVVAYGKAAGPNGIRLNRLNTDWVEHLFAKVRGNSGVGAVSTCNPTAEQAMNVMAVANQSLSMIAPPTSTKSPYQSGAAARAAARRDTHFKDDNDTQYYRPSAGAAVQIRRNGMVVGTVDVGERAPDPIRTVAAKRKVNMTICRDFALSL